MLFTCLVNTNRCRYLVSGRFDPNLCFSVLVDLPPMHVWNCIANDNYFTVS